CVLQLEGQQAAPQHGMLTLLKKLNRDDSNEPVGSTQRAAAFGAAKQDISVIPKRAISSLRKRANVPAPPTTSQRISLKERRGGRHVCSNDRICGNWAHGRPNEPTPHRCRLRSVCV